MIKQHLSLVKASNAKDYYTVCKVRQFTIIADEPITIEGTDLGPSPFDLLNVSLASCTAIYLRTIINKYNILTGTIGIKIIIYLQEDKSLLFDRTITIEKQISEDERAYILEQSNFSPTTIVLKKGNTINTRLSN